MRVIIAVVALAALAGVLLAGLIAKHWLLALLLVLLVWILVGVVFR